MMMQEEQRNRKEKRRRHPVRAQAKSQNRKTVLRYGGAALHGRLSMAGNNRPFPLCAHLEFLQTDLGMSADLIENPSAQKVKKAAGVGGSGRAAAQQELRARQSRPQEPGRAHQQSLPVASTDDVTRLCARGSPGIMLRWDLAEARKIAEEQR